MNNPATLEATIEFRRGSFSLNTHFALTARWTVLYGASGAGKTTLLRILAGLTQPATGSIRLGESQLLETSHSISLPPGRRRMGFVLQQAALFPHLTARKNIAFGLHQWTRPAREARTEELLHMFEMDTLVARKPRQLSGGERQRVALAQALAPRPELLLLDEPFNALDAATRAFVIEKLRAIDVPVLYVSHSVADAWEINADVLLLEAGRIAAQGPTRTILAAQRGQLLAQLQS
ncbi:MAG TPA: ATP-binding cassette domain-containing protein [Acidobacteriaceae bacterium]|nr:ATP-binding cassette domain-containing protein [Acidobacteriaceae bacterium]